MDDFKTVIIGISIVCFLCTAVLGNSTSAKISPSPSTVNGNMQSATPTAQSNATSQPSGNMSSTITANQTSSSTPEWTASSGGGGQGGGQGKGQGQGQGGGGGGGGGGQMRQTTTSVQSAFVSPTSTSSVVQGISSAGGQSSGGQSSGGQSSGGQSSGGQSSGGQSSGGQSSGGQSSGGQSSGGQSSGGQSSGGQSSSSLSTEQRNVVEAFDTKRSETMQKLEIKSIVHPLTTESADIGFLSNFGTLLEDSQKFGQDFDTKFNAKLNYAVNTNSTALQTKKINCVTQRANEFPEQVDPRSKGAAANVISLPLQCPLIVKKAAPASRRRRDVDYSVELKWDHHPIEDPVEYAHMYRYIRSRREAAEQQNTSCAQAPCLDTRLNMTLKITSMNYTDELNNKESSQYRTLTENIKNVLVANLTGTNSQWKTRMHGFELSSGSIIVSFFIDCPTSSWSAIKAQLQLIVGVATFGAYIIDNSFSLVRKVTVENGGWTTWSAWPTPLPNTYTPCGDNYQVKRQRSCTAPSPKNGGKNCEGPSVEYKKCVCGGTFVNTGGTISTPYWSASRNYPMDTECTWVLKAPFNHSVVLKFDQFNFESDKKCFYDYVQVFDGNDTNAAQLMPRTCGTKGFNKTITSSNTIMMIRFRSDKTVNDRGFTATWTKKVQPWKPQKPVEYEEQNVTVTNLISCPTYNDSSIPLGKATTCTDKSFGGDCYFQKPAYLISCVIGVKMSRDDLPLKDSSKINATFKHIMHKDLFPDYYTNDKFCVTWNQSLSKSLTGAWTRKGCSIYSTNFTHTTCQCEHTGIFAILASEKVVYKKLTLLANTYTGIGVSFFLILLAIFHIVWKVNIHGGEVMRMNICVAIIVMMMTFLIGANVEAEKTLCGFLTFLLLFSVLAQFLWLMLHGLRIHGKIKEAFASGFNIEIVYVVFGWGLPLVLSLIAIGIEVNIKNEKDVCWTAVAGGSMWGYSSPLVVIILLNIAVLVAILVPTDERKTKYDYHEMKYRVFKDGILLALFGMTCLTAYLTVAHETFTPQYFLTISVVLQAVAMIIFGREGRKDFVKRKETKAVDMAETLSQNTNEEDILERLDEDSMSDGRSSKKSGRGLRGIDSVASSPRMKNLKRGKEQETDIDA